jgi:cyclic beta-1,2-glucan synthetase
LGALEQSAFAHNPHSRTDGMERQGGRLVLLTKPEISDDELRRNASALAANWETAVSNPEQTGLEARLSMLPQRLHAVLQTAKEHVRGKERTLPVKLLEDRRTLDAVLKSGRKLLREFEALPTVHIARHGGLPRIVNLAEEYLSTVHGVWSAESIELYTRQVQRHHALLMNEIQLLPDALKLAHLDFILDRAETVFGSAAPPGEESLALAAIQSLLRQEQYEWGPLLESLTSFDSVLREDPDGTYAAMDAETRYAYRKRVAELARHADFNEYEVARAAINAALTAQRAGEPDPRRAHRIQHVGYHLFAEGLGDLRHTIGYHGPPSERLREFLLRYNEDFYLSGIITLTVALIVPILAPIVPHNEFWLVIFTLLLALVPVSQGAVTLVNDFVTSLLKAQQLHKMDYELGVPAESTTLVVVPTLLIGEDQVRELFEDLEGRYLANEDPNIHFALLTDLPDAKVQPSSDETDPLVMLAAQCTEDLNAKYGHNGGGAFLLLHRRRIFIARQGVWMGWERKRGKVLDLNKLLQHDYDSFPIKRGPVHVLERVRYVITLDADTKLPYGTASRMIGTISHPLNRAIIHPKSGIVTVGYGILQPRVGVSVASAARSRLAAIYSGETGFDIYTRAISDVYQDLFGEGIFTGKGIYEVSILHRVLEHRFPRNMLLSHDLIEGAYVRTGLVTDVEVIDDYPSHYSAHTRRSHRWIRGDWQILRWLFSPVPDERGHMVPNPISLISQWKIFDNLRRSLVQPVTFLLLVFGWLFLPGGARYWTLITLTLLLLPALVQLAFDLVKALLKPATAATAVETFTGSLVMVLIHLTFLAHQMMLSLDAIVRSLNRSYFSGRQLLEWETTAQAETSSRKTSLDIYLRLSPIVALFLAGLIAIVHHQALLASGPVLFLWLIAPQAATWLNSPPQSTEGALSDSDNRFLRDQALRIWRFYADFAGPENHWLVPDHVEEKDFHPVHLLTPTNIGMLLNARQAACELGFITLPQFVQATLGSLASYDRLAKEHGHVFNWYDLETLRPIEPVVVSTVDSGNLAASFYALSGGALDLLNRPIVSPEYLAGLDQAPSNQSNRNDRSRQVRDQVRDQIREAMDGHPVALITSPGTPYDLWIEEEVARRAAALTTLVESYLPWLLPEFAPLSTYRGQMSVIPSLDKVDSYIQDLSHWLETFEGAAHLRELAAALRSRLPAALGCTHQLQGDLRSIAQCAARFADQMDFAFVYNEERHLLSNGYDVSTCQLHTPCFDLLASEARTAAFLAVAKGDIPQQSWFRLGRSHVLDRGRAVLLSWTATMFEYLMPTLWMRSYPNTLLTNSLEAVIRVQMKFARNRPWGISESGFAATDENGRYLYQAWGVPTIALKYGAESGPVISPYSTFLALPLLRNEALANLRRMASMGWTGLYGFYEAVDYRDSGTGDKTPQLVRSWMAHHIGMSLLAIANTLRGDIFQTWFHANPRVRAAEQLLQEKPVAKRTVPKLLRS